MTMTEITSGYEPTFLLRVAFPTIVDGWTAASLGGDGGLSVYHAYFSWDQYIIVVIELLTVSAF